MSLFASILPLAASPAAQPQGFAGTWGTTIMLIVLFAIFYFLVIRPQSQRNKEHRAMIDAIKIGNEVVFAGGLMGKVKKIDGEYAVISLNNSTEIKIQRAAIISVLPAGTLDSL